MTIGTFVRTPLRLLEISAEYSPGLNYLAKNYYNEINAGGASAAVAHARLATGSIMIGSFMYLAMNGLIIGDPPTNDPKDIKAMEDAGMPPRHWWDPVSQKYRSYAGMEPLSTTIAMGANLAKVIHRLPDDDAMRLLLAASVAETEGIGRSGSMIQAYSQAIDIFKGQHDDNVIENGMKYIRRRLDQFYPAAMREVGGVIQPEHQRVLPDVRYNEAKDLYIPPWSDRYGQPTVLQRELRMLYDDYTRDLPGFGKNRKPDRNIVTGDPISTETWPFNPFTTKPAQGEPWAEAIKRLDGAGLEKIPEWIGGAHEGANVGLEQQPVKPGIKISAQELDRLEVLMTQVVKDGHGSLKDSLNFMVKSPTFLRQPDVTQKEMVRGIYSAFHKMAEARLIQENAPLRRALDNKQNAFLQDRLPLDDPRRRQGGTKLGVMP